MAAEVAVLATWSDAPVVSVLLLISVRNAASDEVSWDISQGAERTCFTDTNAFLQLKYSKKFCMTAELVHLGTVN